MSVFLSKLTERSSFKFKLLKVVIVSCNRDVVQDSDDLIHMGHAIMTFYSALIDLLGRCAPEMHVSVLPVSAALLKFVNRLNKCENKYCNFDPISMWIDLCTSFY